MTSRTRTLLTALIALAWAALGVANIARGHSAIGVLYLFCGFVSGLVALAYKRGRRSR